jgi:hypothetical protein
VARERDITRRPKFFARKRGVSDSQLCEKCRHHEYFIAVRVRCDAMIYTNPAISTVDEFNAAMELKRYLHLWCTSEVEAPACLDSFREIGLV